MNYYAESRDMEKWSRGVECIGRDECSRAESNVVSMLGGVHRVPAYKPRTDGSLSTEFPSTGADRLLLPVSLSVIAHASS